MDDPSQLADLRGAFDDDDLLAVADSQVLALPLAIFDGWMRPQALADLLLTPDAWQLPLAENGGAGRATRPRLDLVALSQPGYADDGPRFCRLGEGMGLVYLLNEKKNRCLAVDSRHERRREAILGWQRCTHLMLIYLLPM